MIDGIIPIGWRYSMDLENIRRNLWEEYNRAVDINGKFASAHEGYAIILEKMDELWEEVKKKEVYSDEYKMRKEALQIAAMAIRFIVDIC
jgi:hypothetical protein